MSEQLQPYKQTTQIVPVEQRNTVDKRPDLTNFRSLVTQADSGPQVIDEFQGSALLLDGRLTEQERRAIIRRSVRDLTVHLLDPKGFTPTQYNFHMNRLYKLDVSEDGSEVGSRMALALQQNPDFDYASRCLSDTLMFNLQCPDIEICDSRRAAVYLAKLSYKYASLGYAKSDIRKSLMSLEDSETAEEFSTRRVSSRQRMNLYETEQQALGEKIIKLFDIIADRIPDPDEDIDLNQIAQYLPKVKEGLIWKATEDTLIDMAEAHGNEVAYMLLEMLSKKGLLSFDLDEEGFDNSEMYDVEELPTLSEFEY